MLPRSIALAMVCVGLLPGGAVSATDQDGKPDGNSRTASVQRGNRLLLIAPERFHAGLSEFVRHKNQLLPTQLVSLEQVLRESAGVDDPERLKRYLYTQWREQQVGYVLLVGDYETGVLACNKAGQDRAAVFVVGGWVDARDRMNHMVDVLAANWSIEKRFHSDGNPTFDTRPPDETQLLELLNDGVGLVIHAGHGSDLAWEQCFSVGSFDRLHNADRLPVMISAGCSTAICGALGPYQAYLDVDGREHDGTDRGEVFQTPPPPPAVYQRGRFNPTGLGEQLLRQRADGAVAYIGCNTGSQPCALTLVEGFTKALAADGQTRLGDCWSDAIAYYYQHEQLEKLVPTDDWYPASIFFQGMKFMLFGDPSLRLQIARDRK